MSLGAREGFCFWNMESVTPPNKKRSAQGGLIFELVEMGGIEPPCMEI